MSTAISWTDETWNPTTGCHKVSEGCRNCYASKLAPRLAAMGQKGYTDLPWTKQNAEENVYLHEDRLEKPLRWKKSRRVFVNSMSDLFHELVPFEFIDRVFAVMALSPQHTFQVLTKRPERMAEYLLSRSRSASYWKEACPEGRALEWQGISLVRFPLPNVQLGTSIENQKAADERIPHLKRCLAVVRFLSCEPLLGPLEFSDVSRRSDAVAVLGQPALSGIHWIIAGGESGPGYREMDPEWARSLRDQCVAAGVPFFFKQSSGLRPETNALLDGEKWHQFPATEVAR